MSNAAPKQRDVSTIIGTGGSTSATWGATIVRTLAKKLQKPRAVAENKVGKTSTVATYTMMKHAEIPNFVITTKIGIQTVALAPRKMITKPPTVEIIHKKVNDFLIPSLLYNAPPQILATRSVPELERELL
jgi:hypothetical protein